MYKVLISFSDNVDGGVYYKGGEYPRDGAEPDEERIEYLLGRGNKFGKPVIAKGEALLAKEAEELAAKEAAEKAAAAAAEKEADIQPPVPESEVVANPTTQPPLDTMTEAIAESLDKSARKKKE